MRGLMRSFPPQSAWWLQAVDFHTLFTSSHSTLSLKSVRKLHPRAGMRAAWAERRRVKAGKRNQELVKKPRHDLRGD